MVRHDDNPSGWGQLSARVRRLALTSLSLLLTLAVLGFLVYRQRSVLFSFSWQFHPLPLLISFGLFAVNLVGMSLLWGWMINTLGKKVAFRRHVRYYILSNVAKRLPGTVWYVASRVQMYRGEGVDLKFTSMASGMELAMIVLSAALVSVVFGLPIALRYQLGSWVIIIAILLGLILVQPRVVAWLFRVLKLEASSFSYRQLLQWLAGYCLSWISGGMILFTIANIVTTVPIENLGYFIGSWTLVGLVSTALLFSPSNFGVTEIGLSLLLSTVLPAPVAVVVAILARILLILYEILLALFFYPQTWREKEQ